jgi:hypothetical protein
MLSVLIAFMASEAAFAQCFDLSAARISHPEGTFREHWDHPLWNSKPGTANFQLDEKSWGGALQFALFAVGVIRKESGGWLPYRTKRVIEIRCDPAMERAGPLCYAVPYQVPPASAVWIAKVDSGVESWSVDNDGTVRYRRARRGNTRIVASLSKQFPAPKNPIDVSDEDVEATLDLKTGSYHVDGTGHAAKAHLRRFPGGTQIWRTETFNGHVEVPQVPCPVATDRVSLTSTGQTVEIPMSASPSCVVKVTKYKGSGLSAVPIAWEFKENPQKRSSWQGCVLVFETPPSNPVQAAGKRSKN